VAFLCTKKDHSLSDLYIGVAGVESAQARMHYFKNQLTSLIELHAVI